MANLRLDTVRKEVPGAWASAQALFWIRAAEAACEEEDWPRVTKRLLSLADAVEDLRSGSAALRELAVATLEAAVRTDDPAVVRDAAARVLGRAWTPSELPDELQAPLRVAHPVGALKGGEALAVVLEGRFPHWPHGYYAAADFGERIGRRKRTRPQDAEAGARRFLRAAELFENRGDGAAASHCRLRASAMFMDFTPQIDRARELARSIDAATLAPAERLWLAYVQAQSPFWLDRVRAADFVSDVMEGVDRGDPAFDAWTKEEALSVGRTMVERLPSKPQGAEVDRLQSLLARVDGQQRWELEAQLQGRLSVAQIADVPLDEVDVATAREVERDALPLHGFTSFVEAWHRAPVTQLPLEPVSRAVVQVLSAAEGEAACLEAVTELARVIADAAEPSSLRPVSLVFHKLLAEKIEEESLEKAVTQVSLHYIRRGPAPSYGFWALAANLFGAGLQRAGAAAVERALASGEPKTEFATDAIARSVQWAVRSGTDQQMLDWLVLGQEHLA